MAQELLQGRQSRARFQHVRGKSRAVRISILPMKCPLSRFTIVTIRFMENTVSSFAGYGGTRVIK
jgi:hypothetical protein